MNYGVIIARFHVPELHIGHIHLIESVREKHDQVVILLGISACVGTDTNPLSYSIRREMIRQHFPDVVIEGIRDNPYSDKAWSNDIDSILSKYTGTPILYGSRKSFIPHYKGDNVTVELANTWATSGTVVRQELMTPIHTTNFRAGMIHQTMSRLPIVYPTVDIALFKDHSVLLGKRNHEPGWRFPGGFVDPKDASYLLAAKRELSEEVGLIETNNWSYVGSIQIDDPRYHNTKDSIMTTLFKCHYTYGYVQASDDLDEVKWIDMDELSMSFLLPTHQPLLTLLREGM